MDLLDLKKAKIAAAIATRRLEIWLDFEDVKQSAALGFWKGWRAKPDLAEDDRNSRSRPKRIRRNPHSIPRLS